MTTTLLEPTTRPDPAGPHLARRTWLQDMARLGRHSLALAGRGVRRMLRTPEQFVDVTLQPIIFVVMFVYLFGGAVAGSTHEYLQFVLPAIMVQTVVFSTNAIGVNMNTDITKGVFDRFRSLPIPRVAPLAGAVLADVVRYATSTVVIIVFGYLIGFRIATGPLELLGAAELVMGFALCLCWVFVLLGLLMRSPGSVQGVGFLLLFPLTFGSNFFVPTSTLPGWLQGWVHINPLTHVVEAVRGLLLGGPVAGPVLGSIGWGIAIVAVFAPLAVRAYRRRT
jgi:oleandomycin transport system permease protein